MKLLVALALAAAPARAGWLWFGPSAKSVWRDRTITVDGDEGDWDGIEQGEDAGLSWAFANDALDLFILLSPHDRNYREQLSGVFDQDFTVWLDPSAGMQKNVGLRLKAPPDGSPDAARDYVLVRGSGERALGACESAELRLGPVTMHGVLEARVPLACFGAKPGEKFTVGFEAEVPKQPPPKKPGQHFDRLYVFVRVKPAKPPQ